MNPFINISLNASKEFPVIEPEETFADWLQRTDAGIADYIELDSRRSGGTLFKDPDDVASMKQFLQPPQPWVCVDISALHHMWVERQPVEPEAVVRDIEIADTLPTRLPYPCMIFESREPSYLKMDAPEDPDAVRYNLIHYARTALVLQEVDPNAVWEEDGKSVMVVGLLFAAIGSDQSGLEGIRPNTVICIGAVALPPWASITNGVTMVDSWITRLEKEVAKKRGHGKDLIRGTDHVGIASLIGLFAMRMIHAKNVEIAVAERPRLNRQHRRALERKGVTLGERHKIVVRVPGSRQTVEVGEHWNAGERNQHMVRGHFSTYTAEKPLFGKHTGTYWIPAHVRGTKGRLQEPEYVEVPAGRSVPDEVEV